MAIRPVITAPDPRLKMTCKPVEKVDDSVRALMADMLDSMYAANGIGLAAPQVGDARRVIVVDVTRDKGPRQRYCLANPEIVGLSDELFTYEEGCLSLPEQYADVTRPARARIRYLDEENKVRELEAEGLLAVCIQHEMDHLDGILFVDHVSTLKRNMIMRKLAKAKRQRETEAA
jgi:peptide deformylase